MSDTIILTNLDDAVDFLLVNESLIKAARSLYKQILHNDVATTQPSKDALLNAIEIRGLSLAEAKAQVFRAIGAKAFPIVVTANF